MMIVLEGARRLGSIYAVDTFTLVLRHMADKYQKQNVAVLILLLSNTFFQQFKISTE